MEKQRVIYITRRVEFAASHRLYKEGLSESDNFACFGKCANPHGHGHNYILEVTLRGVPDPKTELVIHYKDLKRILEERVVEPADHHNLNIDVPFMKGALPTSENILYAIWETLVPALTAKNHALYRLRLASTERSWVEYYGPEEA